MESIELVLGALLFIGLTVFLSHFFSKRASLSLANADERTLKIGGKICYYALKWVTVIFLVGIGLNYITFWPPHWLERTRQRKIVLERVQDAGGWRAIKSDCEQIVTTGVTNGFHWFHRSPDAPTLPKSLAMLKPRMVDIWPEKDGMQSVRIHIFGMHSTGGRGQDFYILKVVCPSPPNVRSPFKSDPEAKVKYGDRKIADGSYEVTGHS
jgi:hypothetical protein